MQFGAGYIERLRRQEGVDEKIGDAVTTNECDGFGKFARTKVPVLSPIRMVEALEEGAKTIAPFFSHCFLESIEPGRYCGKCAEKKEAYYVAAGHVPSDWIPAEWQRRAAAKIGMRRCRQNGNGWSIFRRDLPDGWEWCDA